MFATSRATRLLLHVANLMVIAFILLPLVAVFIGSIQSEKALQADTRRLLPLEFTLDNFTVILSKGEQKGQAGKHRKSPQLGVARCIGARVGTAMLRMGFGVAEGVRSADHSPRGPIA